MLRALQKEVPNLTNQVGAFAEKVVVSLNNASEQWAIGANQAIATTNQEINDELFGWVNTTTGAVNDTLNTFVEGMTKVLDETFGDTILHDPIKEVLNCLITLKIVGIQKALTWVSDHAHINFPQMANDTFSLGAVASIASDNPSKADSFLSNPDDVTTDKISSAVIRLTNKLESGIKTEALISTTVVLIWVIVLLMAIIRALTLWFGRDKTRAQGGVGDAYCDTRDGFHDIPLGTISEQPRSTSAGLGPAPKYTQSASSARSNPFAAEDDYQEQKLGFAGQRDYDSSLRREATKGGHSRVSSHGEVHNRDYKQ
jgi:hypothetical protein